MVIAITLIVLFLLFFMVRKNVGPAILGMIAGLSVHEMFGKDLAQILTNVFKDAPIELLETSVFLVLVLLMPLVIYFQASRGGLFGLLRILEAGLVAALLTILVAGAIGYFLPLDDLSNEIITAINSFRGPILMAGIAFAYFDIMFYRT